MGSVYQLVVILECFHKKLSPRFWSWNSGNNDGDGKRKTFFFFFSSYAQHIKIGDLKERKLKTGWELIKLNILLKMIH